jgi:hypothetical protein
MASITRISAFTGKPGTMDLPGVTEEDIAMWRKSHTVVQQYFPQLDPDQCEFLLTGALPGEYDAWAESLE